MIEMISSVPARRVTRELGRIRVVHIINSLEGGGAETALLHLSKRFDRDRFDICVAPLARVGPIGEKIIQSGVPVASMDMGIGKFKFRGFAKLVKKLRYEKPDVVMTWLIQADYIGYLAAKYAKAPTLVWNLRNSGVTQQEIGKKGAMLKSLCAKVSGVPKAIVVNSEAGLHAHERIGFQPREWLVIPNGFNTQEYKPDQATREKVRKQLGVPDDVPLIGLIAHWRYAKNHPMFLQAVQRFSQLHPNAHYLLAGRDINDKNEKLKELAGPMWGDHRLHLLGEIRNVPEVLCSLDLMTMCSFFEGFPNAVGESMAVGVPCVVTTTSGDAPKVVGSAGRVVDTADLDGFVAAWDELISKSPEDFQALRNQARQRIIDNYSIDAIVEQYANLFTRLTREAS